MTRPILIASTAPCVHCGSGRNHLVCHGNALRDGTPEKLVYQVTCAKCRASGPVAQSADEAAEGWANRAQPVLLSGLDFEEEKAAETAA